MLSKAGSKIMGKSKGLLLSKSLRWARDQGRRTGGYQAPGRGDVRGVSEQDVEPDWDLRHAGETGKHKGSRS